MWSGRSRSSAGAQRDPREAKILIGVRASPWLSAPAPLPSAPWRSAASPWVGDNPLSSSSSSTAMLGNA